jgi:hypothetical protein
LDANYPAFTGKRIIGSNITTLKTEGISKDESSNARIVYREPEIRDRVIEAIISRGDVVTPAAGGPDCGGVNCSHDIYGLYWQDKNRLIES